MKIFLSWSGHSSKLLATALRGWLPLILHYADPWLSDKDIAAGDRWGLEVGRKLEESQFGIICLTLENLDAPWILFEAGALSKALVTSAVCPYLLGVEFSDIVGPLSQFQAKKAEEISTFEIIQAINSRAVEPIENTRLTELFEALWPKLQRQLQSIPADHVTAKTTRTQPEILEELVASIRGVDQRFRNLEQTLIPMTEGEAEKEAGIQRRVLLDIQQKLTTIEQEYLMKFPWPDLLRQGMIALFAAKEAIKGPSNPQSPEELISTLDDLAFKLGARHSRDIQISVADKNREYVYHDWHELIGDQANYTGSDEIDIYEEVYKYPYGAVGWIDHTSNVQLRSKKRMIRMNIALFSTLEDSGWKVVVETHHEID